MAQESQNIFQKLMGKINPKPVTLPADTLKVDPAKMSDKDKEVFKQLGVVYTNLAEAVSQTLAVNYERQSFYAEATRAQTHALMSGALSLYTNTVCRRSAINNATVWVTADNRKYENVLMSLFDSIDIESKIADWTQTTNQLGDLFVEVLGAPGKGIVGVMDDKHPIDVSRIDYNGRLIGFYDTPMGSTSSSSSTLLPPWKYVHFRVLGAVRRRPMADDITSAGYRTISLLSIDTRRATSRYGTSIYSNALPIYKRLRLSEDSVLMGRVSRTVLRYLYKVGMDSANSEGTTSILDSYTSQLKRMRSMNTTPGGEAYTDVFQGMSYLEDTIIPVWGGTNQLTVEKLGGDVDIKWIVDVDDLRSQLAIALAVPLQLLGYAKDLPAFTGASSLDRMDIRFAQNASNLQRAMISGITRLCQIHLAYLGMNPDSKLFEVHMADRSSAEEMEVREGLEKNIDICAKFAEMATKYFPDLDKTALFEFLNKKILKMTDFDPKHLTRVLKEGKLDEAISYIADKPRVPLANPDIKTFLPCENKFINEGTLNILQESDWDNKYGKLKVTQTEEKGVITVETPKGE